MAISHANRQLDWPNVAKAGCIILVVILHWQSHFPETPWLYKEAYSALWYTLNELMRPLRMPLFFLVSGLLASDSILRPRATTLRKRLHKPLYLYIVWGLITAIATPMVSPQAIDNIFARVLAEVGMLAALSWYLAALAIYYVLAKMTLKVPVIAVLVACMLLSIMGTIYQDALPGHQHKILRCALFFAAGVRLKSPILAFANAATGKRTILLGAAFAVGAIMSVANGAYYLPVDMIATAFGISLSQMVATRMQILVPSSTWIAHRTLPIYLIHFLILPAVAGAATWFLPQALLGSFWLGLISPVMLVPPIIATSLVAHRLLLASKCGWLFDLPSTERSAVTDLEINFSKKDSAVTV
ncbi:acyltransferase [Sphingobium sp.]|uniref:acyltransferase family protein n=1 Tax=Sphingobium sp. TaxID=1912891 RepID=UPI00262B2D09|nr:acyltransferase [Sphingobium sp.]